MLWIFVKKNKRYKIYDCNGNRVSYQHMLNLMAIILFERKLNPKQKAGQTYKIIC